MAKLRNAIVELYRLAATSLPADIEAALRVALKKEKRIGCRECFVRHS